MTTQASVQLPMPTSVQVPFPADAKERALLCVVISSGVVTSSGSVVSAKKKVVPCGVGKVVSVNGGLVFSLSTLIYVRLIIAMVSANATAKTMARIIKNVCVIFICLSFLLSECGGTFLPRRVPPHPLQEISNKRKIRSPKKQIAVPYRFSDNSAFCTLHSIRSALYPIIPRRSFVVKKNRLTEKDGK
jgi:hypothetical protein